MITLDSILLSADRIEVVPIDALGESHALSDAASKMFGRFYGLRSVARHADDLTEMLGKVLRAALAELGERGLAPGHLIYCKTQTHNTMTDQNWLRALADAHGIAHWESWCLTMTSCASALVQMHFARLAGLNGPMIILTGEKAFHPSVSRLSVGLLAEIPTAAVFFADDDPGGGSGWRIRESQVRHLGRFHSNPDAMDADARRALQDCYLPSLISFVEDSLHRCEQSLSADFVFLPHNLNRPVTDALIRHFGWESRNFRGDLEEAGHAYCSDIFVNLDHFLRQTAPPPGTQLLVLAAGTGVTFAICLIERLH
ncbi:MAG: 3-oxoacyl-[acyl-carrier-protein] synthase III C-terminal domain-containing protein [Paracoccaceae bacterium]